VNVLVMFGLLIVAPAAVFWLMPKVIGWCTKRAGRRRHDEPHPPPVPNLQRLVDDLRRIEREYLRVERSDLPARAARLRALNLAYDDTLRACCHELGLAEPVERPLSGVVRLQTEAELAQHGLVW
jgi:hypothetical protein